MIDADSVLSKRLRALVLSPWVVLGCLVTGALVASDRRTTGTVAEDQGIEVKAANRIQDSLGDRAHVNVTSYNRQVLITGEVPSAQDKQLVEKIVAGVENVRNVVNELNIMGNSSLLYQLASAISVVSQTMSPET